MSHNTPLVKLSEELAAAVSLSGIPAGVDLCPALDFQNVADLVAVVTPIGQTSARHTRAGSRLNETNLMVLILSPATVAQLPGLLERIDALVAVLLLDELPSARITEVEYVPLDIQSMQQARLFKATLTITAQYISTP